MTASPSESIGLAARVAAPAQGWVLGRGASGSGAASVHIWGLSPEERLLRSLRRAGCHVPEVVPEARAEAPTPTVVLCRGDVILDERIVTALAERAGIVVVAADLGPIAAHVAAADAPLAGRVLRGDADAASVAGATVVDAATITTGYVKKLRKWEPLYAYAAHPDRVREVEARTFDASYKGATDLVTKWLWPRPAAAATRWCARRGVAPNTVTLVSWVLALAAIALFAHGAFALGLVTAWAMTFLDTVDGKLARVTLTSSRLGDVLDHSLDLLHPPFWWFAWGVGVGTGHELATAIAVGGYVVGRLLEGAFLAAFKIETHSWRPIDAMFRTITARRNPNLILLTVGTAGGRPDLGLVMLALWTVFSLGFHVTRLVQAFFARGRGDAIVAWDDGPHRAGVPSLPTP